MLRDFDLSVCEDQNKRKSYFVEMQRNSIAYNSKYRESQF